MNTVSTREENQPFDGAVDSDLQHPNTTVSAEPVPPVSEAKQADETKESEYQAEDDDPFMKHVRLHFRGTLRRTEQLNKEALEQYFEVFYQAVQQLAAEGKFWRIEEELRTVFLEPLKNHLLDVMARQLLNIRDDSLSIDNLYGRVDNQIFGAVAAPQWQSLLKIEELDPVLCSLSSFTQGSKVRSILQQNQSGLDDEVSTVDVNGTGAYFTFRQLFDSSKESLESHGLLPMALQLLEAEQSLLNNTLALASAEIQNIEEKTPGFYIDLLCVLDKQPDGYADFHNITYDNGLQQALGVFRGLNIPSLREKLFESLSSVISYCHQQRDDYRLQFYAQWLAKREAWQNKKRLEQGIQKKRFYTSTYFIPEEHDPENGVQYYHNSEAGLTNPYNLLAVTEGDEADLSWLVHQYAEYELEVLDEVIEAIDFEALGLDKDIASYILDTTFLDHEFDPKEVLEGNFIPKVLERLIERIKNKVLPRYTLTELVKQVESYMPTTDTDCSKQLRPDTLELLLHALKEADYRQNGILPLPSLPQLVECIKKEFTYASDHEGKIQELRKRFNNAWHRKDWPEVQKLWPVFTKFQRLLASTEEMRNQVRSKSAFRAGRDYNFQARSKGETPRDYNDLLDKAWKDYEDRAKAHYMRLYPAPGTNTLSYSAKKCSKVAKMDLTASLGELEIVGRSVSNLFPRNSATNIVIPVLYFVVSNKPHQQGGDHGRIFIPVNLEIFPNKYEPCILSNDYEDKVFLAPSCANINSEFRTAVNFFLASDTVKRESFKAQAISDCKAGYEVMDANTPSEFMEIEGNEVEDREAYRKLAHSERVLIELLRKPECNQKLVTLLESGLKQRLKQLDLQFEEEGQYKVYAIALLAYSSNSICNYCTPSLISLQGSHSKGFIHELAKALNAEGSHFKTAGYNNESHTQSPGKLPMLTIITSDSPWDQQAFHLLDTTKLLSGSKKPPRKEQHMENPKGIIYLPNNEIDLHSMGIDLGRNSYLYHRSLVEFVRANFNERHSYANNQPPFLYTGHSFMSGSKREKFGDKAAYLDDRVKEVMQRRKGSWETRLEDKETPASSSLASV